METTGAYRTERAYKWWGDDHDNWSAKYLSVPEIYARQIVVETGLSKAKSIEMLRWLADNWEKSDEFWHFGLIPETENNRPINLTGTPFE